MKYLIVGLGNMGAQYDRTRHNIGFMILDAFAAASNVFFTHDRLGDIARTRCKNCELVLLKPSTFMNLSGNAVRYWLQKENIDVERLLVLVDDLALPLGTLRLKPKGSAGGHNGLRSIEECLGTQNYARLRFGIGNNFPRGGQIDYVLSPFAPEDDEVLQKRIDVAADVIRGFCLEGIDVTMNKYNK